MLKCMTNDSAGNLLPINYNTPFFRSDAALWLTVGEHHDWVSPFQFNSFGLWLSGHFLMQRVSQDTLQSRWNNHFGLFRKGTCLIGSAYRIWLSKLSWVASYESSCHSFYLPCLSLLIKWTKLIYIAVSDISDEVHTINFTAYMRNPFGHNTLNFSIVRIVRI